MNTLFCPHSHRELPGRIYPTNKTKVGSHGAQGYCPKHGLKSVKKYQVVICPAFSLLLTYLADVYFSSNVSVDTS
jgi:hypothetical protein